jgi:predicted nucleic acid-binding protein
LFPIVIPATSVLDRSFHLDVHFSLSHWDATLLAACREAGVTRLDSEDLSHGTDYDGVVVVNPFLAKN